jgi:hypothetical protein
VRAKADGIYAQKSNLAADIVGADGVCEAPPPPLVRTLEAIATLSRRALLSVAEDTALGVSSRPKLVATSYPQSFSEGELRGLFRSRLKTIYR